MQSTHAFHFESLPGVAADSVPGAGNGFYLEIGGPNRIRLCFDDRASLVRFVKKAMIAVAKLPCESVAIEDPFLPGTTVDVSSDEAGAG
jgi:hypothetical protein